jgi:hypothetical protein
MKWGIEKLKLCFEVKDFVLKLNKVVMDELKLAVTTYSDEKSVFFYDEVVKLSVEALKIKQCCNESIEVM